MAGRRPAPRVLALFVALGIASAGVPAEAWAAARPAASVHVGALGVLGFGAAAPHEQSQSQPGHSQRQSLPDDDDDDDLGEAPVLVAPPGEVVEAPGERIIEVEVGPGEVVEIEVDGVRRVIEGPPVSAPPPVVRPTPERAPRGATPPPVELPPPAFEGPRPRVESSVRKDTVSVRIASPTRMTLEMRVGEGWRPLCGTPCSVEVPRDAELRVSPRDNRKDTPVSRSFRVPDDRASIDLVVRPGSKQQRGGGVGLALLSAAGILTGAVMVEGSARYSPPGQRTYEGYIVVGLASLTFALGVGMAVTGRTRVIERKSKNRLALVPGGVAF